MRAAISPKMRPMVSGPFSNRPAPYDRNDRFGGANRFNNMGRGGGPGGRNFQKGTVTTLSILFLLRKQSEIIVL